MATRAPSHLEMAADPAWSLVSRSGRECASGRSGDPMCVRPARRGLGEDEILFSDARFPSEESLAPAGG
jgi:hypothetical protein